MTQDSTYLTVRGRNHAWKTRVSKSEALSSSRVQLGNSPASSSPHSIAQAVPTPMLTKRMRMLQWITQWHSNCKATKIRKQQILLYGINLPNTAITLLQKRFLPQGNTENPKKNLPFQQFQASWVGNTHPNCQAGRPDPEAHFFFSGKLEGVPSGGIR